MACRSMVCSKIPGIFQCDSNTGILAASQVKNSGKRNGTNVFLWKNLNVDLDSKFALGASFSTTINRISNWKCGAFWIAQVLAQFIAFSVKGEKTLLLSLLSFSMPFGRHGIGPGGISFYIPPHSLSMYEKSCSEVEIRLRKLSLVFTLRRLKGWSPSIHLHSSQNSS